MPEEPYDTNQTDPPAWRGYLQLALVLGAIVMALLFARAPDRVERGPVSDLTAESVRPTVPVIRPESTDQALTVELTATVGLEDTVNVASEVAGRVAWVSPNFANGGSLSADETFIRVDPAEFELQVEAAEMAVREADAQLAAEKARGGDGARAFALEEAEARLLRAEADLKLAELHLARTNISYPYASRVINADVAVGELVGPAEEVGGAASRLGAVYRLGALQVDAPIEPRDLEYLDPVIGRTARVVGEMGTWRARVVRVSSVIAPKTRLASVFLKFAEDEPMDSLPAPGTFVEIDLEGPAYDDVYVLPESVLQERDSVWVVRNGLLSAFTPTTLGRTAAGWIVQAFDAGDGVVVGALPAAREGLEVEVRDAASPVN
ncbi:MAG: hypothetical protein F4Y45_07370 [Acidobacteria bacterium]|nr:hypothetical protein [Acidobacteriota bacterium]MXZ70413.1 hypothetical protein [Acidobacteriota bacterium]MYD70780.1 hypothetical protein [Acidobacteriota bacterium]MYJ06320.1 hypothetical protein [Acidobacteriota bacterium]